MSDSKSYSSLFALVDSHLSKVSLEDENVNSTSSLNIPHLRSLPNGSVSETSLLPPSERLPSFGIGMGDSAIRKTLSEQVSNMLKAKEKKLVKEMEQLKIEEEEDTLIDLTQAIISPYRPDLLPRPQEEVLSKSDSCESLFKLNFTDYEDDEPAETKPAEPLLPCITDMSYILKQNIKRGKGSAFGRVLSSRQKRVAAPYLREVIKSDIVRFDFTTPSPCDIIREKLRKPKMSCTYSFNIEDFLNNFE